MHLRATDTPHLFSYVAAGFALLDPSVATILVGFGAPAVTTLAAWLLKRWERKNALRDAEARKEADKLREAEAQAVAKRLSELEGKVEAVLELEIAWRNGRRGERT